MMLPPSMVGACESSPDEAKPPASYSSGLGVSSSPIDTSDSRFLLVLDGSCSHAFTGVGGKQTVLDEAEEPTRGIMSASVKPS
ncbi:uncharacterized protein UDID_17900 [Ustilago sp. UG-2017a]|nr:uncharacterized protein UDID_17900 [Ustilago sp. UG-2017a]